MFGYHIKDKKNIKYIKEYNCNLIQLFADELKTYKNIHINKVVHSSFIINISHPFSINNFNTLICIKEIKEAIKYKAIGYVLHMGKIKTKINMTPEQAIENMIKLLCYLCTILKLNKTKKFTLYLELLSGQKNDISYMIIDDNKFISLYYLNNIIKKYSILKNLKYCIDTCHIFTSGYDIRTKTNFKKYISQFNKYININNIGLIHLNDSYYELNSRLDKHENIGYGKIGKNLIFIYEYFNKHNIPIIMEVPDVKKSMEILKK